MRGKVAKEIRRVCSAQGINYKYAKRMYTRLPHDAKRVDMIHMMMLALPKIAERARGK